MARAVTFSSDSTELVAGADDGMVWTWDARTGVPAGHTLELDGPVYDLAFDRISDSLAVGSFEQGIGGVASVFARGTQTPLYKVNVDDDYGRPGAVSFSPDGTVLATGGGKGDVRFWDATTGAEIGPRVLTSAGWVLDLAWTPSGKTLGQLRDGRDGSPDRCGLEDRRRVAARSRERLGRCDRIAGRLARVRRIREWPGLRLVDRPGRLGEGRLRGRRSEPHQDGMGPVPAEPTVRPCLHPVIA